MIYKAKLISKGFFILEVMVAFAIISGILLIIFRLQLANLTVSQKAIIKQAIAQSISTMANEIYAHLNYLSLTSIARNANYYSETSYLDHTAMGKNYMEENCCNNLRCNNQKYANCALSNWKRVLASMNLPLSSISAIVCLDNNPYSLAKPPTISDPFCSGNGKLVIKVVWQLKHQINVSSFTNSNFIIMPVPER